MTENYMNTIDIKKIMAEAEAEVGRMRVANKYKRDLKLLEEFGKVELKDSNLYDLKMQSYHTKTIQLPKSLKKGMVSKFSNKFILKLYFIIGKMFDASLRIQQKINTKFIDEVIEIKKSLGLVDLDHFPYRDFKKAFPINQAVDNSTYEVVKGFVNESSRIVDLNAENPAFLNSLASHKPKDIFAVNRNVEEISQLDVDEAIVVEHREIFEFLSTSGIDNYDLLILQDTAEYLTLNYLITVIKEANRTLSRGGRIVVRSLDPRQDIVLKNTFDPKIQKLVHPQMLKFLLEFYNFSDVEILENIKGMEGYYVAIGKKI